MRELRFRVAEGESPRIVALVRKLGIDRVRVHREFVPGPDHTEERVCVEASASESAQAIDELQREGLLKATGPESVMPLEVPRVDLDRDLSECCRVTPRLVTRVGIAATVLSFGMLHGSLLLTAAGLFLLPGPPHLLAIGRGLGARDGALARRGVFALGTTVSLVVACGALVARMSSAPLQFGDFLPLPWAAVLAVVIGVIGTLASLDDVGKRELVSLAIASQLGLVPAWLGIGLVHGFNTAPGARLAGYGLSLALMIATSAAVFWGIRLQRRDRSRRMSLEPSALAR